MNIKEINQLKRALLHTLELRTGIVFDIPIVIDREGSYPQKRDFAKTDGMAIYFSPKILKAGSSRVDGLLRHELAHAILMNEGLHHSEADTDRIAEWAFGDFIFYDEDGVQSTLGGTRPRPAHLPN